jgi:translocation and assembly module TamB
MNLETRSNKIHAAGNISLLPFDFNIKIQTQPIIMSEFSSLTSFHFTKSSPWLLVDVNKKDNSVHLESTLADDNQRVNIDLRLTDYPALKGSVAVSITNLSLVEILGDDSPDGLVNGNINLKGSWINENDSQIELTGELLNSSFLKRDIKRSDISAQLNNGSLKSNLSLAGDFGLININSVIDQVFNSPSYSFRSTTENLNLSRILLIDSLNSDLNLTLKGEGTNFNPDDISGHLQIVSNSSSRLNKYTLDSLQIGIRKTGNRYILDSLFIQNNKNQITAEGDFRDYQYITSKLQIKAKDFRNLKPYLKADTLSGSLSLEGEVTGSLDSLEFQTSYNLSDFQYNDVLLNSFKGNSEGILSNYGIAGRYNLQLNDLKYGGINILKLYSTGTYKDKQLNSEINLILPESLAVSVLSSVVLDSGLSASIPRLTIKTDEGIWQNNNGGINFSINDKNYLLHNFNIQNDTSYIYIDTEIKNEEDISAEADIHSFALKNLFKRLDLKTKFSGLADIHLNALGKITNPEITGDLKLTKLNIDQNEFGILTAGLHLKDKIFNWDLLLAKENGNELKCSGYIPLNFPKDSSSGFINEQKEFYTNLSVNDFDLAKVKLLSDYFDKIEGKVNCDISVSNNLINPQLKGSLELSGMNVQKNKYGIDYKNINVKLKSDSNKISIEKASFPGNKGLITLSGYIGSKTNILRGKLNDINLNMNSSGFELINGKGTSVLLDGNLKIITENDRPSFYGDFKFPKSGIYLASISGTQWGNKETAAPLLLQAVSGKKQVESVDIDSIQTGISSFKFGKNINGQIKINIPDNTWVKSPIINIELKGDIILKKQDSDLTLTGRIEAGRGYLYLYGKKFIITKGELDFNGEKDINPLINVTLVYSFRNPSRERETININVTNTVRDPKIIFTHQDELISEKDAISYILFGIKMESLTQSQQTEVTGNENVLANAVTGMLASQISSKLGNTIGLDVFEITGEENWESASLTAGKYLTTDLFVSYERDIPLGNSNETEINKLSFEYELFKFLFFQLVGGNSKETGINFIIKFD